MSGGERAKRRFLLAKRNSPLPPGLDSAADLLYRKTLEHREECCFLLFPDRSLKTHRMKETLMKRTILAATLFAWAVCLPVARTQQVFGSQQTNESDPYQGVSHPPSDDTILVNDPPQPKPSAAHRAAVPPVARVAEPAAEPASGDSGRADGQSLPQASSAAPSNNNSTNDNGIVQQAASVPQDDPSLDGRPAARDRSSNAALYAADPDGDIVHPRPVRHGELIEGSILRVRLLQRLSTASNEKGEIFRTALAADVLQDGQVLMPAGTEIDGHIAESSHGTIGGHGVLRLRPETVILPDGSRFRLRAETSEISGAKSHIGDEGEILPDSRVKRGGLEYGGAVGAGATTGAIMAGPVGALTGGLIGAGVVTAHLLISHPQDILEAGTNLTFTLTEPLSLIPARNSGE
jgi:hypothetical protein